MSAAARSVVVFGVYLAGVGLSLLLAPGLLPLLGFPLASDFWVRVAGMLLLIIAYTNVQLGRQEVVAWFRVTVQVRSAVPVFFIAFVLFGSAPGMLVLFGLVDLAGALWTAAALRGSAGSRAMPA